MAGWRVPGGSRVRSGLGRALGADSCYAIVTMDDRRRPQLTDAEIAEIRRHRPGVRASLACEDMYLAAEEEALLDQMEHERLTPDERARRVVEFCRAKRRQKAAPAT